MTLSLKDQNKFALLVVVAANLAIYYAAVQNDAILAGKWVDLTREMSKALPAALGLILVGVANALLPQTWKARIVFLRWKNPLPGSEAFTKFAYCDDRIDVQTLGRSLGPLPTDHRE